MTKNNSIYDAVSKSIEDTIEHFIDDDPYYYIAPYLSKKEIDKRCPFFTDNRITLPDIDLCSDDLRTMSHLATFHRNRIAYNPKSLDHYLRLLKHIDYDQNGFDILCYETLDCSTVSPPEITYEEWLLLSGDYVTTYDQTVDIQTGIVGESLAYAEST